MEPESFSNYRIIDEETGNIVYRMMINNTYKEHNKKLVNKMDDLSYEHGYNREKLFFEEDVR